MMCDMCNEERAVVAVVIGPDERDAGSVRCKGHAIDMCADCASHGECGICYW